jgi:hypothetical protein
VFAEGRVGPQFPIRKDTVGTGQLATDVASVVTPDPIQHSSKTEQ